MFEVYKTKSAEFLTSEIFSKKEVELTSCGLRFSDTYAYLTFC